MKLVSQCFAWLLIAALFTAATPSPAPEGPVRWLTFEEAVEKSKTEKKKIFVDVYTDWCGWCKVMDKNTFSDPHIAKILNEDFYPVKFDAEQQEEVVFNGHTFKFIPHGNKGTHELAMSLLNNKLSYPSFVILNEEFKIVQPLAGYIEPKEFHKIIQYIGEDYFRKMSWEQFQASYQSPY